MNRPRPGHVNVDELQQQVTLEQVAAFYSVPLPGGDSGRKEVRLDCPFECTLQPLIVTSSAPTR